MNHWGSIYEWIKEQEILYTQEIEVINGWFWGMKEHIRKSMLYKHGKFSAGLNDYSRPNKNIVYPILNLRYRAEDIDVKDVNIYVDDSDKYHLSFLVKKYHDEVFVKENDLETFFDEAKEEKIDFGGTLVRNGKDGPVYEPLESIVFCDQTDLLSGPIGFKLFFSPDELYEMEAQGWGKLENGATVTIEELITLAENAKQIDVQRGQKSKTPGKYIEVYRVHGMLPTYFLKDDIEDNDERYIRQIQIIGFYKNQDGKNTGVTLYRKQEYENPFKIHLSGKKIRNRALAYGGVEELFDPQVWTNYSELQKKNMLDSASKVVLQTTDTAYANRNKIRDMENLEITVTQQGTRIDQVPNGSPNVQLFNEWINEWQLHAQTTGGATDALLGKNPSSGTPFRLENLITQQGQGLHDYRQGKYASFLAEIYTDWIIPKIKKSLINGRKFLATLSVDEMEYVADCLVRSETNEMVKEKIINGEMIDHEEVEAYKAQVKEKFMRGGNKNFLEILKGELKEVSLSAQVNIVGKQRDLAQITDKLVNIFRQVLVNPAVLQDPQAQKIFLKIIEYSGLEPSDFSLGYKPPQSPMMIQPQVAQPALSAKELVPA